MGGYCECCQWVGIASAVSGWVLRVLSVGGYCECCQWVGIASAVSGWVLRVLSVGGYCECCQWVVDWVYLHTGSILYLATFYMTCTCTGSCSFMTNY